MGRRVGIVGGLAHKAERVLTMGEIGVRRSWRVLRRSCGKGAGPTKRRRALRILAWVPRYPPVSTGGAQQSISVTLRHLAQDHGCDVVVLVDEAYPLKAYEELIIRSRPSKYDIGKYVEWSDVVFTQLSSAVPAARFAVRHDRPVILFARSAGTRISPPRPDMVVYNAQWMQEMSYVQARSVVVHPPIFCSQYAVQSKGAAITLVNLSPAKGSRQFYELSKRFKDQCFLGVKGSHGRQVVNRHLGNVEIWEQKTDMREVYKETQILLIPSSQEAFGRVGLEAACSGIPAIAHPSRGVKEALGDAAVYADRNDLDSWERALEVLLTEPEEYRRMSQRARERAISVDPKAELEHLYWEVEDVVAGMSGRSDNEDALE